MSQKQVVCSPGGTLKVTAGTIAIGAAGLSIAVPAGKKWQLIAFNSDLTTSATVGNRIIQFRAYAPVTATPLWIGAASGNVAASQVGGYDVGFGVSGTVSTTVRRNRADTANTNVQVREMSPLSLIGATGGITIDDSANIDNADSISYALTYVEYEA